MLVVEVDHLLLIPEELAVLEVAVMAANITMLPQQLREQPTEVVVAAAVMKQQESVALELSSLNTLYQQLEF
jgi:hypothetical protein